MRHTKTRKLNVQCLEDRTAPSFGFGSAFRFGDAGFDTGHDIAIDSAGNVYLSGYYSGTVDFDPNGTNPSSSHVLSTANNFQGYAAKYLSDGTFQWARDLGTGAYTAIDVQGSNVFVAVSSWIGSSGGPYDLYAYQLNATDGLPVWTKFLGSAPAGSARMGVAAGPSGSAYVTGINSSSQAFVTKLNSAGNAVWTQTSTGDNAFGLGIAVDAAGNAYSTGGFAGTVNFGGSSFTSWSGTEDAFVWKIDANGNSVKAVQFRSNGQDRGWGLATDSGGNVIITGQWGSGGTNVSQNNDFDPSNKTLKLAHYGLSDSFVVKLNSSLQLSWAKSFGGSDSDFGRDVAIDSAGNIYTTGSFTGPVDFDPGSQKLTIAGYGNRDIYVSKLNANGSFVAAAAMGGSAYDDGTSIALDGSGNVWTTGGFRGTADFDPTSGTYILTQAGYPPDQIYDAFVSKLTQTSPQFAAGDQVARGHQVAKLTANQLSPILSEAIARWTATGLPSADVNRLRSVSVSTADLEGEHLGSAAINGSAISLDVDAAGYGWFVDLTPVDDAEFAESSRLSPAMGKMDLLTVVMHELGHVIGLDSQFDGDPSDLMYAYLGTGERRLPNGHAAEPVHVPSSGGFPSATTSNAFDRRVLSDSVRNAVHATYDVTNEKDANRMDFWHFRQQFGSNI